MRSQNCKKRLLASSCLSVRPSVRIEQLGPHWTEFHEIWYSSTFRKYVEKIQVSSKYYSNNGTLHEDQCTFMIISGPVYELEKYLRQNCRENQNTHFMYSNIPPQSCHIWYNVDKFCRAGHATDNNVAHAHCMLDNQGYKHTLRISNIICLSIATMFVRTRLSVTSYVHCLFCYNWGVCFLRGTSWILPLLTVVSQWRQLVTRWECIKAKWKKIGFK